METTNRPRSVNQGAASDMTTVAPKRKPMDNRGIIDRAADLAAEAHALNFDEAKAFACVVDAAVTASKTKTDMLLGRWVLAFSRMLSLGTDRETIAEITAQINAALDDGPITGAVLIDEKSKSSN